MAASDKGQTLQEAKTLAALDSGDKPNDFVKTLFQRCVAEVVLAAEKPSQKRATELNFIARRVDDAFFRLQIWASDIIADSKENLTFSDILDFTDGQLRDKIEKSVEELQHNLNL